MLKYFKMMHKVFPDREKAKSIFNLALAREKSILLLKTDFTNRIVENYYEVIKEIASALLLLKGVKFTGENAHKEIIDSLSKNAGFSESDISILQDLRIRRNNSLYEGKPINPSYLENNEGSLADIIDKLKKITKDNLR